MQSRYPSLAILILVYSSATACAQSFNSDPGVNFFRPTRRTIEWIRANRPRHVREAGSCTTAPRDTSTTGGYYFDYKSDTVQITIGTSIGGTTINKYDRNDTLRYSEWSYPGMVKLQMFDSLGRQTVEIKKLSKEREKQLGERSSESKWAYRDDGHSIRTEYSFNYVEIEYYSLVGPDHSRRKVDSTLEISRSRSRRGKKSAIQFDTNNRDYSYYDADNHLVLKRTVGLGSSVVDSFFYHPNGIVSRSAAYAVCGPPNTPSCLCREEEYDSHGNEIRAVAPSSKFSECGEDLDTTRTEYQYDSRGRPTLEKSDDSRVEYQWGDDDRPLAWKSFGREGEIWCDVKYVYEFEGLKNR